MITIFRYSLALALGYMLSLSVASAKEVTVNVEGYGITYKTAVTEGLKEAISQVYGVTIDSTEVMALSSSISETTGSDNTKEHQSFSKETQSNFFEKTKGYISGYQVLNSSKSDDGTYIVNMTVNIEKYVAPGGNNNRRAIAVLGFKASPAKCFGNALGTEKQVDAITNSLVSGLTATRKFSVLDRDNEDVYALEKELIAGEDAKRSELSKLGMVRGSDYIVTGTIKHLELVTTTRTIGLTGDKLTSKSASADIDYRLLLFADRQVKMSSSVHVKLDNNELSGLSCDAALSKLMQKATDKIVTSTLENIYPPIVVSIKGDSIYLNIGGENIQSGKTYAVYALGEKIIDPYTGESLGAEETKIAILKISDVKPKYSIGTLIEGKIEDIQNGQICRPITVTSEKAVTAPSKKVKKKISEDDW